MKFSSFITFVKGSIYLKGLFFNESYKYFGFFSFIWKLTKSELTKITLQTCKKTVAEPGPMIIPTIIMTLKLIYLTPAEPN